MSTNEIQHFICKDDKNQIGYDGFGQLMWYRTDERGHRIGGIIANVIGKKCAICGKEWTATPSDMTNQYYHHSREVYMHETCYIGYLAQSEWSLFHDAVLRARKTCKDPLRFKMTEIPNQYGGAWNTPWWKIEILDDDCNPTRGIVLTIGPRKRVFQIQLEGECLDFDRELFKDEDVTKNIEPHRAMIHAWGEEQLYDYVERLLRHIPACPKKEQVPAK